MISVFDKPDTPQQAVVAMLASFMAGFCVAAFLQKFIAKLPRFIWPMAYVAVILASYFRRWII